MVRIDPAGSRARLADSADASGVADSYRPLQSKRTREADDGSNGTHRSLGRRCGSGWARARVPPAAPGPANLARRPERAHRRQLARALGLAEALFAGEPRRAARDAVP